MIVLYYADGATIDTTQSRISKFLSMLCSLSGETPKEPVVSPKSGAIFERRLIESYLASTGKDPVSDEPLSVQELVPIKTQVPEVTPPRPPTFNSIPTMLAAFQNEWDALALETYTLRKQLHTAREELSLALYQYDAAVRVAAKAIRERDEARLALTELSAAFGAQEKQAGGSEKIPVQALNAARDRLFAEHKNQKVTLGVSSSSKVQFSASIEDLDIDNVAFLSAEPVTQRTIVASTQQCHVLPDGKRLSLPDISETFFLSKSEEKLPFLVSGRSLVEIDSGSENALGVSAKQIVPHPTEPLFCVLTDKGEWALCDRDNILYKSENVPSTAIDLHVDGVLLGVGTASEVLIFDLTSTEQVAAISTKHAHVNKIQFALNGYWLVVGSSTEDKSAVQIFDLRKNSLVHEIDFDAASDFVLDPSCLVLTTYSNLQLVAHLYVKKGKKWYDAVSTLSVQPLHALTLNSTAATVQETNTIEIIGLGEKHLCRYTLSLSQESV